MNKDVKRLILLRCDANKLIKLWESIEELRPVISLILRRYSRDEWKKISEHQKLSEDFIREFKDKVKWVLISWYQTLSGDFIREFKDNVNWYNISWYQTLSDEFIREFKDNMSWYWIARHQTVSDDFMREEFNR